MEIECDLMKVEFSEPKLRVFRSLLFICCNILLTCTAHITQNVSLMFTLSKSDEKKRLSYVNV